MDKALNWMIGVAVLLMVVACVLPFVLKTPQEKDPALYAEMYQRCKHIDGYFKNQECQAGERLTIIAERQQPK